MTVALLVRDDILAAVPAVVIAATGSLPSCEPVAWSPQEFFPEPRPVGLLVGPLSPHPDKSMADVVAAICQSNP